MRDNSLIFVAGLPRSGSTLLLNLLGQNPAHHVTPTSGLIELFVLTQTNWPNFVEFKAEGLERVKPRVRDAMRGMLHGYFASELAAGKTVFDKSRGWLQYVEPLEEVLQRNVRIIVPVRDIRAIIASFEKLYRKRSIDFRMPVGEAYFQAQTIEGRAHALLAPGGIVGLAINRLRDALMRGVGDRLLIVPYPALSGFPEATLDILHDALGLPSFAYDPLNVEQVTEENDAFHGMDLHRVRRKVSPPESIPWEGILPQELCEFLAEQFADIHRLSNPSPFERSSSATGDCDSAINLLSSRSNSRRMSVL